MSELRLNLISYLIDKDPPRGTLAGEALHYLALYQEAYEKAYYKGTWLSSDEEE